MIKLQELYQQLNEGVYDPSIFKCIMLAGGPGSGKSYVGNKVTAGMGFKFINSDTFFEKLLRKADMSTDINAMSPAEYEVALKMRNVAKDKTKNYEDIIINGRLGIVIDGTGKDYEKIERHKKKIEQIGYDTYMVFVNTSLEVALERNQNRERKVPEEVVKESWTEVQQNMGKFQNLFGNQNFIVVDNNEYGDDKITNSVWKQIKKISEMPPRSKEAKEWIAKEKELKRR